MTEMREDPRFPGVQIHESSYVDAPVEIGAGTRIWHFSHVLGNVTIGANCSIGQNVVIGPRVTVGKRMQDPEQCQHL
jgi:UDP-2-acetamido-3-amino-2,3-dideoxy-glucuronate N-acetyltransferase